MTYNNGPQPDMNQGKLQFMVSAIKMFQHELNICTIPKYESTYKHKERRGKRKKTGEKYQKGPEFVVRSVRG